MRSACASAFSWSMYALASMSTSLPSSNWTVTVPLSVGDVPPEPSSLPANIGNPVASSSDPVIPRAAENSSQLPKAHTEPPAGSVTGGRGRVRGARRRARHCTRT